MEQSKSLDQANDHAGTQAGRANSTGSKQEGEKFPFEDNFHELSQVEKDVLLVLAGWNTPIAKSTICRNLNDAVSKTNLRGHIRSTN